MPIVTTRSVVLQTHPYSDTSKILRLMTYDHGPQSALARGAMRPRSQFSGVLESFAEGVATLYMRENRELHTLSGFELSKARQEIGRDLVRYAAASVLCELVLRLAPAEHDPLLFDTLTAGLDATLASGSEKVRAAGLAAIWSMVDALGFAPELETCSHCGRPIVNEACTFDVHEGCLACRDCLRGEAALNEREVETLKRLVAGNVHVASPSARQAALLVSFIQHHAAEGIRLRSLDFLLAEDDR